MLEALSDDLNTSKALASVDEFVKSANDGLDLDPKNKALKAQIAANLEFITRVFGVGAMDGFEYFQFGVSDDEKAKIKALLDERAQAKKEKNFSKADEIREKLNAMDIAIMDTAQDTMWEKI